MIFIDGFEEFYGASSTLPELLARADWLAGGQWSVVTGRGNGSAALAGSSTIKRVFPWSSNVFVAGVAHQFTGRGAVMSLKFGGVTVTLWMHPENGLPMLNDSPGGALPTINRWYYYELTVDRLAGTVTLHINNKVDSSIPIPSGGGAVTNMEVTLGKVASPTPQPDTANKIYDDFYANDVERIGPVIVTTRFPDVDVTAEWFKASPTMTHAESLSQHPPDPLDSYVAADTLGKLDKFTSNDPLANDDQVLATGILVMARKAPTLNAKLNVFLGGNDSTLMRASTRTVGSDWHTEYVCFDQENSDTPAKIEASEFGINVAAP